MMPILCPGKVGISFFDHNGDDAGFELPCNNPLTTDSETGEAVCHNGHRWPAKETVYG